MKLFDKIRILRKARGLSQEQLGYSLSRVNKDGISRQTVSDWENGKFEPKLENIRDLAEVFDVSFDALLDESVDLENEEVLKEVLSKKPYTNKASFEEEEIPVVKQKRGVQLREVILFIVSAFAILIGASYTINAINRLVLLAYGSSYLIDAVMYLVFGGPALGLGITALILLVNAIRRDTKPKTTMVLLTIATSWLVFSSLFFDVTAAISWYQAYQRDKQSGYNFANYQQVYIQLAIAYTWELTEYTTLLVLSILCFKKFENKKLY